MVGLVNVAQVTVGVGNTGDVNNSNNDNNTKIYMAP